MILDRIIQRLREKESDGDAWDMLYAKYQPTVMGYLTKSTNLSDVDKQDIYQEAIIKFYEKLNDDSFTLTSQLITYLIGVCNKRVLELQRKQKRRIFIEDYTDDYSSIDKSDTAYDDDLSNETETFVRELLSQLKDNCRNLLIAKYFNNKSYKEIVKELDIYANVDSAKNSKKKCIEKLQSIIINNYPEWKTRLKK